MPCVRCSKTLRAPLEPGLLCLLQAHRLGGPAAMQRVKLLKASAKGSPGSLFGSPQHSASEVDGVVFDGLELGPELQFLFTSGAAPSPARKIWCPSGAERCARAQEYEEACREFGSAEPSPTKQRKQRRTALRLQTSSPVRRPRLPTAGRGAPRCGWREAACARIAFAHAGPAARAAPCGARPTERAVPARRPARARTAR